MAAGLLALLCALPTAAHAREVLLVVRRQVQVSTVSYKNLIRLYFGKTSSIKGAKVIPYDRAVGSRLRAMFFGRVFKVTPAQFDRYWIQRHYTTGDTAPRQVANPTRLLRLVVEGQGIAFLWGSELSAKQRETVRVVARIRE